MNLREYQTSAIRTANTALTGDEQLLNAALGLTGEAGEFAEVVKKWRFQGHELDLDKARKELGDVLWYAALAAHSLGVSLDEVVEMNVEKRKARYPDKFTPEMSVGRVE